MIGNYLADAGRLYTFFDAALVPKASIFVVLGLTCFQSLACVCSRAPLLHKACGFSMYILSWAIVCFMLGLSYLHEAQHWYFNIDFVAPRIKCLK